MKTRFLRMLYACAGISVGCALGISVLYLLPTRFTGSFFVGFPLVGFGAAHLACRLVPGLRWRELLASLPLVPFLTALLALPVALLTKRSGFLLDEAGLLVLAASTGVFMLPLFDARLRQSEPDVAVSRKTTGLVLAGLIAAALVNAFLVPAASQTPRNQSGYNVMGFFVLSLLAAFAGWIASVAGAKTKGTPLLVWGSLAAVVSGIVFSNTNVSF